MVKFVDLGVLYFSLVLPQESGSLLDDDDVYYYMRWRLKLEGETENMGVCTKERKGINSRSPWMAQREGGFY